MNIALIKDIQSLKLYKLKGRNVSTFDDTSLQNKSK